MNNPAYSGSGIAPPTNAHADAGSIRIHPLPVAALVASLLLVTGYPPAFAATRTVGPGGQPTYTYGTIDSGFASITPDDTILVYPGTYKEKVAATTAAGSSDHLGVIKAVGTVIIDGRDPFTPDSGWIQYCGNVYYYSFTAGPAPEKYQLFDGDIRYTYKPSVADYCTLATHEDAYDPTAHRFYANAGGGSPVVSRSTRDRGFELDSTNDYLSIEGFAVVGVKEEGIRLRGSSSNKIGSSHNSVITARFSPTDCRAASSAGRCRVAPAVSTTGALARSGLGAFHHPALLLV